MGLVGFEPPDRDLTDSELVIWAQGYLAGASRAEDECRERAEVFVQKRLAGAISTFLATVGPLRGYSGLIPPRDPQPLGHVVTGAQRQWLVDRCMDSWT